MTIYLPTDDVVRFNAHFVGPNAVRDLGAVDGAVHRPQSSAFGQDTFPTIHEKAAALLHGLVRNHPFLDGNKRTAWASTTVFYMINGFLIIANQGSIVALVIDAAEGQIDVPYIAGTLKSWAKPFDFPDTPH